MLLLAASASWNGALNCAKWKGGTRGPRLLQRTPQLRVYHAVGASCSRGITLEYSKFRVIIFSAKAQLY